MQKLQQGFTLIELMIVVAIIGILAALAVPAYQDYTIRTKVSEAASLSGAARTAVDIWFSESGGLTMPGTDDATRHASLGISQAESYDAKYVESVLVQDDGDLLITLKDNLPDLPTEVEGDTVMYSPRNNAGGNLEWVVSFDGSSVPDKYLPRR